jgi:hypothetical protein
LFAVDAGQINVKEGIEVVVIVVVVLVVEVVVAVVVEILAPR